MRDRFGATNPRAQQLRFHTQTAGSTLTAQQPDNNIVRVAIQALAAVLGGTQSLHCNGRDEALALPTEESARIALRTQQIIACESGVVNTVDPVAGSWCDRAGDQPHRSARRGALLERIDAAGGTLAAIEQGLIQREIQESAYRAQQAHRRRASDRGRREPVHDRRAAPASSVLRIDPEHRAAADRARRRRCGPSRDPGAWRDALDAVAAAARDGSDNLVPPIIAGGGGPRDRRRDLGRAADVFGEHSEIDV